MERWDDLRYFAAVVRQGSLSAAARALGVNHSTVSRRVAALEAQSGVVLFDRLPEGYVLTQAGAALLETCEGVESAILTASRTLAAHDNALEGILSVTAPQAMGILVLMPMIRRFRERYPRIQVDFLADDDIASLARREADVAIRASSGPDESLTGRKLCTQSTAVYAARAYWETAPRDAPDWISHDSQATVPHWLADHYPGARLAIRTRSKLDAYFAVKAGLGVARLPCRIGDADPELRRIPPDRLDNDLDIWLLMHPDLQNTPRVRAFADFIYEVFRSEAVLFAGQAPLTESGESHRPELIPACSDDRPGPRTQRLPMSDHR